MAALAFRRWCSSLTLSSPDAVPGLDGLWAFLVALGALLILAILLQGPWSAFRQFLDLTGHFRLVRRATRRVWGSPRLVAAAITFTVLAWTASQTLGFLTEDPERGKADLALLTRSRSGLELALDQGILAALTPLRDLAGLADNLPLLIVAVYLVFRASSGLMPQMGNYPGRSLDEPGTQYVGLPRKRQVWSTFIWGSGALYVIYRLVARAAGSPDLPIGGCLMAEAILVPIMMLISDGFLMGWVLAELRNGGFEGAGDESIHPGLALELMPAAMLACLVALPGRYMATLVFLALQHLPTSIGTTAIGRYVRWQLGWGLVDFQAASLVFLGLTGVVAWSRGSIAESLQAFRRLLQREGGHLAAMVAMSGVAACLLAGVAYGVVLLLPPAGWVLTAADSYAHYLTLPVGLWTLAACIELAERSLPVARIRPVRNQTGTATEHQAAVQPAGAMDMEATSAGSPSEN
jgi:hypothetical protein